MSLIKEIRNDPVYRTFKEMFERVQQQINTDKDYKEVVMLHESRTSRNLRGGDRYSPEKLIDANLVDLSVRSRLVRIRAKSTKQIAHLESGMEAVGNHVMTEYAEDLRDYKTEAQRRALIARVMKAAKAFVADVEAVNNVIDSIIKDIDQASYHLKASVDLLKLWSDSKGRTV